MNNEGNIGSNWTTGNSTAGNWNGAEWANSDRSATESKDAVRESAPRFPETRETKATSTKQDRSAATILSMGGAAQSEEGTANDPGAKLAAEMNVFNDVADQLRGTLDSEASFEDRVAFVQNCATELFGLAPTWTAFYREILGAEGLMRTAIFQGDEMAAFETSAEHCELLKMLTVLRSRDLPENDPFESQKMITVRIPKSLHDSICEEANQLAVSVNKLCITRLLQRVDATLIPSSTQKRRGRRPGTGTNATQPATEMPTSGAPAEESTQPKTDWSNLSDDNSRFPM